MQNYWTTSFLCMYVCISQTTPTFVQIHGWQHRLWHLKEVRSGSQRAPVIYDRNCKWTKTWHENECTENQWNDKPNTPPKQIDGKNIDRVNGAKIVGLHIQNNIKWDAHVKEITEKAKKTQKNAQECNQTISCISSNQL